MLCSPVVLEAGFGQGKTGDMYSTTFVPMPGFAGSIVWTHRWVCPTPLYSVAWETDLIFALSVVGFSSPVSHPIKGFEIIKLKSKKPMYNNVCRNWDLTEANRCVKSYSCCVWRVTPALAEMISWRERKLLFLSSTVQSMYLEVSSWSQADFLQVWLGAHHILAG